MPVMVGKPCVRFLMNCIMNSGRARRRVTKKKQKMVAALVTTRKLIYYPAPVYH